MAESIIARLTKQEDNPVEWLLLNDASPNGIEQGSLQDLANIAKGKPITLLFSASAVLLLAVDLPVKSTSQINKALPFALEDYLADDVETYHLVWYCQPKYKVCVAAISHGIMQAWLAQFESVGIEPFRVYPESLCLPYQDQACSILIDDKNAILRTGQWLGGGVDVSDLPILVDKLLAENPRLQAFQVWNSDADMQSLSDPKVSVFHNEPMSPLQLLQQGAARLNEELNLLSGRYARKNLDDWQWQKWLPALGIFLLAVFIQTGVLLNSYWAQKTELAALETKTLALFKQTFPDVKRIVNIKVQAEQQLADLKKQSFGNGSPFMQLLYGSGITLNANSGFQLQRLDFVNNVLQLQLTAQDINQLEQFKKQLESANSMSVKILSAESAQNTVEAHLEIGKK